MKDMKVVPGGDNLYVNQAGGGLTQQNNQTPGSVWTEGQPVTVHEESGIRMKNVDIKAEEGVKMDTPDAHFQADGKTEIKADEINLGTSRDYSAVWNGYESLTQQEIDNYKKMGVNQITVDGNAKTVTFVLDNGVTFTTKPHKTNRFEGLSGKPIYEFPHPQMSYNDEGELCFQNVHGTINVPEGVEVNLHNNNCSGTTVVYAGKHMGNAPANTTAIYHDEGGNTITREVGTYSAKYQQPMDKSFTVTDPNGKIIEQYKDFDGLDHTFVRLLQDNGETTITRTNSKGAALEVTYSPSGEITYMLYRGTATDRTVDPKEWESYCSKERFNLPTKLEG